MQVLALVEELHPCNYVHAEHSQQEVVLESFWGAQRRRIHGSCRARLSNPHVSARTGGGQRIHQPCSQASSKSCGPSQSPSVVRLLFQDQRYETTQRWQQCEQPVGRSHLWQRRNLGQGKIAAASHASALPSHLRPLFYKTTWALHPRISRLPVTALGAPVRQRKPSCPSLAVGLPASTLGIFGRRSDCPQGAYQPRSLSQNSSPTVN